MLARRPVCGSCCCYEWKDIFCTDPNDGPFPISGIEERLDWCGLPVIDVSGTWTPVWNHEPKFFDPEAECLPPIPPPAVTAAYEDPLDVHPRCILMRAVPYAFSASFVAPVTEGQKWRLVWNAQSASDLTTAGRRRWTLEVEWVIDAECPVFRIIDTDGAPGRDIPTDGGEQGVHVCYNEALNTLTARVGLSVHHQGIEVIGDPILGGGCLPQLWIETDKDHPGYYYFVDFTVNEVRGTTMTGVHDLDNVFTETFTGANASLSGHVGDWTYSGTDNWTRFGNELNCFIDGSPATAQATHDVFAAVDAIIITLRFQVPTDGIASVSFRESGGDVYTARVTQHFVDIDSVSHGALEIVGPTGDVNSGPVLVPSLPVDEWHALKLCAYKGSAILHAKLDLSDDRAFGQYDEYDLDLDIELVSITADGSDLPGAALWKFDDVVVDTVVSGESPTAEQNDCPCCGSGLCQTKSKRIEDFVTGDPATPCWWKPEGGSYVWQGSSSGINARNCEEPDDTAMLLIPFDEAEYGEPLELWLSDDLTLTLTIESAEDAGDGTLELSTGEIQTGIGTDQNGILKLCYYGSMVAGVLDGVSDLLIHEGIVGPPGPDDLPTITGNAKWGMGTVVRNISLESCPDCLPSPFATDPCPDEEKSNCADGVGSALGATFSHDMEMPEDDPICCPAIAALLSSTVILGFTGTGGVSSSASCCDLPTSEIDQCIYQWNGGGAVIGTEEHPCDEVSVLARLIRTSEGYRLCGSICHPLSGAPGDVACWTGYSDVLNPDDPQSKPDCTNLAARIPLTCLEIVSSLGVDRFPCKFVNLTMEVFGV